MRAGPAPAAAAAASCCCCFRVDFDGRASHAHPPPWRARREDIPEYDDYYDFSASYADLGPEEVAAAEAAGIDLRQLGAASGGAGGDDELHVKSSVTVDDATGELVFSDGRVAGHRAFRHIYRQKLRAPDMRESVVASRAALADAGYAGGDAAIAYGGHRGDHRLLALGRGGAVVRAPGGPGGLAHLPRPERVAKVEETRAAARRQRFDVKLGISNNKSDKNRYERLQVIF